MIKLNKTVYLVTSGLLAMGVSLTAAGQESQASQNAGTDNAPAFSPMQQPSQGDQETIKKQIQSLESEFMQVVEKIQSVQAKALEEEEVAAAKNNYEDLLEEKMIEENPDLETTMAKRDKYKGYIEKVQAGEALPDGLKAQDVYSEYQSLEQQVVPVQRKVMQDKEVRMVQQKYQKKLVAEMKEIDPDIMQLVDRQNQLRQKYRQLMQKMQGMSG